MENFPSFFYTWDFAGYLRENPENPGILSQSKHKAKLGSVDRSRLHITRLKHFGTRDVALILEDRQTFFQGGKCQRVHLLDVQNKTNLDFLLVYRKFLNLLNVFTSDQIVNNKLN